MRLKEEQIARLAEHILEDLTKAGQIVLKKERGTLLAAVKAAISADVQAEAALEKDAERLMEQTIAAMGREAAGIDRHKMLRMIKEKLARERKMVL
jgi:hypothetical protein